MSVILDKFKNMRGTPKKLRNLADVAVLLTNDVRDSCGASYGHAYRNGWTFSVAARDCALSQLTVSHGIAHNFGVDHYSGYLLNKRDKKEFVGVPANYMHFNTHIDESCFFHLKGKGKDPASNMLDFQKLNKPTKRKQRNDIGKKN